jgi:hypothetical protein
MFERELDYYVITANTDCITATERIIDKSIALAHELIKPNEILKQRRASMRYFSSHLNVATNFARVAEVLHFPKATSFTRIVVP